MGTTIFVWDPVCDCVLMELDETDNVKAVCTNEARQYGGVLSQRRGTTSHYHHHDALGSTRFLTDSSGNVTDTYLNDAWGNSVASTGSTVNPFKWVGKYGYYTDNSTGQVYVRARMYQPIVASWSSNNSFRRDEILLANPVDSRTPSGSKSSQKLRIRMQPLFASGSRFGLRLAQWDFILTEGAPCEGFIVHKVTSICWRESCGYCVQAAAMPRYERGSYWEFWHVLPNQIISEERFFNLYTDMFSFVPIPPGTQGGILLGGDLRFYCKDKAHPAAGGVGTGDPPMKGGAEITDCGFKRSAGVLRSTLLEPLFWNEKAVAYVDFFSASFHSGHRLFRRCEEGNPEDFDIGAFIPGVPNGMGWAWSDT
jgi:hypothetical protein